MTFGLLMILYLGLQFAYSFKLKNIVIIDVMIIAAGFVIRVGAGVSLVEVTRFSPWLYVCMTLLGLFMGFGKRRQELFLFQEEAKNTRASLSDYSIQFLDEIITIVAASTIMAYALYTFSAPGLPDNHTMMLTIPFVIYAIFRYLHLLHVQGNSGDPSEILLYDRPLQLTVILWGVTVIIILYRQALASLFNL
jgi:4-hydroxybenzoate polyprenyltransferase